MALVWAAGGDGGGVCGECEGLGGARLPDGLSGTDKKLLAGAGVLAVVMVGAAALSGSAGNGGAGGTPSTYSSASGGARAAYLLLEALQYRVRRWEEPPTQLPRGVGAVLILAEPAELPSNGERRALREFLVSGGRVLFSGAAVKEFFYGSAVAAGKAGQAWQRETAAWPSEWTRGARTIVISPACWWTELSPRQKVLYGDGERPHVVAWKIGRGEVEWWAAATPLTNGGIREADNEQLFLNAVGNGTLDVYWDEYFHGERASLWSYVKKTPVKWGLMQLGLLAAALLFGLSRRWGPVADGRSVGRTSPMEFVETLGGLYERAGATEAAAEAAYRQARGTVARRLAMPFESEDEVLAQRASERWGWEANGFAGTLERARRMQEKRSAGKEVLAVVQELARYTERARVGERQRQEAG